MKTLARIFALLSFVLVSFGLVGMPVAQALNFNSVSTPALMADAQLNPGDAKLMTEFGQKIDVNNSHIREFRDLRGFYPNLASTIIKNAPYDNVEEVLDIPGLSERQKERLQANLDKFTATPPSKEMNEGDDRINPGVY